MSIVSHATPACDIYPALETRAVAAYRAARLAEETAAIARWCDWQAGCCQRFASDLAALFGIAIDPESVEVTPFGVGGGAYFDARHGEIVFRAAINYWQAGAMRDRVLKFIARRVCAVCGERHGPSAEFQVGDGPDAAMVELGRWALAVPAMPCARCTE